jgi:hypothetical protein
MVRVEAPGASPPLQVRAKKVLLQRHTRVPLSGPILYLPSRQVPQHRRLVSVAELEKRRCRFRRLPVRFSG